MQRHSLTKVPVYQITLITFPSNKCSMHGEYPLSHCYSVVLSRCSRITWRRFYYHLQNLKSATTPSDLYHLITRRRSSRVTRVRRRYVKQCGCGENRTRRRSHFRLGIADCAKEECNSRYLYLSVLGSA